LNDFLLVISKTNLFSKKIVIYRDGKYDGSLSMNSLNADYVHHSFHIFINIYQYSDPFVEVRSDDSYLDLCAILGVVAFSFVFDVSQLNW
jgi:hypothetical protein